MYGIVFPFNPGSHYDLISRLLSIIVLGGLGSLGGAVVAALFMGVCEAVFAAEISPTWSSFTFFVVLIAMLVVRPQGLFGARVRGAHLSRLTLRRRRCAPRSSSGSLDRRSRSCSRAPWVQNLFIFTLMYAALATAWNIVGGYSGYISLGHAAFFGVGAYAIGIMFTHIVDRRRLPARSTSCRSSGSASRSSRSRSRWIALPHARRDVRDRHDHAALRRRSSSRSTCAR